jgi:alpha-tubulin suppressor-like RCC1 family protein
MGISDNLNYIYDPITNKMLVENNINIIKMECGQKYTLFLDGIYYCYIKLTFYYLYKLNIN